MNGLNLEEKYERDQASVHSHNQIMAFQTAVNEE